MIYDLLEHANVGDLISYDDLDTALGRDFRSNRRAWPRALREMEETRSRTCACVTNEGYRVVAASQHKGLALVHQKRSRRQIVRASQRLTSADRRELSAHEAEVNEKLSMAFQQISGILTNLDRRVRRNEELTLTIKGESDQTARKAEETARSLARTQELLRRHGITDDVEEDKAS
jgi:hypothetical protein